MKGSALVTSPIVPIRIAGEAAASAPIVQPATLAPICACAAPDAQSPHRRAREIPFLTPSSFCRGRSFGCDPRQEYNVYIVGRRRRSTSKGCLPTYHATRQATRIPPEQACPAAAISQADLYPIRRRIFQTPKQVGVASGSGRTPTRFRAVQPCQFLT